MTHSTTRTRATILLAIAVAMAFVAVVGAGLAARPAQALTNCSVDSTSTALDSEEQAFLAKINQYRAQNGRSALTISTNLNRAAAWMAQDMATKGYFSHTDSLGRNPSTRAQNCGYPSGAGENIAAGTNSDTAAEAFEMWRNSSGHNQNMLNSSYVQIGIARYYDASSPYRWYWVTDFGLVNDGTSGGSGGGSTATATATRTATAAPTQASTEKAALTSPRPGSTLSGSAATFQWTAASGADQYFLYIGTSQGANNIHASSTGTSTSQSVSGLPTDGRTLHVRVWTLQGSSWLYNDYQLRAATVSSGGGATTTATPAPTQTASTKAAMQSPAPGSTLPGSTATFKWSAGQGAQSYYLYVGTSPGASNIRALSTTGTSASVGSIPTDGRTIYVRLWTRLSGGWQYTDYTYRAATVSTGGEQTTSGKAAMTSPVPGSRLSGSTVTFSWTRASGASQYYLYVGTSKGASNILARSTSTSTSYRVSNLPTDGRTIYVRLWTRTSSGWSYTDYTYSAAR